jgi:hypothetical protein
MVMVQLASVSVSCRVSGEHGQRPVSQRLPLRSVVAICSEVLGKRGRQRDDENIGRACITTAAATFTGEVATVCVSSNSSAS